ncbi:unnamed protein product [Rotaria sp. Silwood2]|nr:unnamed protein product [Rotaria sp. Silwood2]
MATVSSGVEDARPIINNCHLEIFSIIWLDNNIYNKDIRNTELKLRDIINRVVKFQDVQSCQKYIEEQSKKDRLVVIVSGRLGREIVPSINTVRQVVSIYVYCMDKKSNKEWADKFSKVKAVTSDLGELVSHIKDDHKIQKQVEEPLSINIFTIGSGKGKSTSDLNGKFLFSQVLIDCLLKLKSTEKGTNEVIKCCKQEYKGNNLELHNIQEFEQTYSPDKALNWYSREAFFFKTINTVLRNENTRLTCLFRTYISDIYRQLKSCQITNPVRVYRGQHLSTDELETLKKSTGHFISVNSFFSTSLVCQEALVFLNDSNVPPGLEKVLFDIDADPKFATTKPFSDISAYSVYKNESEVLFMLGCIFRLNNIERSSDNERWIIKMTLSNENDYALKNVLIYMRDQLGSGDTNLRTLAQVLWRMGKIGLAEEYFQHFLEELSANDPLRSTVYEELGDLASQNRDYDKSVEWHQKALDFKSKNSANDTDNNNKRSDHTGKFIERLCFIFERDIRYKNQYFS